MSSILMPLALIVLGLVNLFMVRRIWLLAAATGALLGLALLRFLPGGQGAFLNVAIIVGLAILGGVLGVVVKGLARIVVMGVGFFAGGALVIALLDTLGLGLGLGAWLLALVGGVIGLVVLNRFFDWGIVIVAALVGAALTARGVQLLIPTVTQPVLVGIWVVLLVVGIVYRARAARK